MLVYIVASNFSPKGEEESPNIIDVFFEEKEAKISQLYWGTILNKPVKVYAEQVKLKFSRCCDIEEKQV